MKLVLLLFLSSVSLAQQSHTSTSGPCSPIAPNNSGSITINCKGLSKEDRDALRKLLNDLLDRDFHSIKNMLENIESQVNTTGTLEPDTRPSPAFAGHSISERSGINIFFGGNLVSVAGNKCIILNIDGKNVLWVEKADTGVLINASVFDPDKKIMAEIEKNNVTVNPNNTFKREIKKHTLVVVDQSDQEVLNVDFVNPHAMIITGIFYLEGNEKLVVGKESISAKTPLIDSFMSKSSLGCTETTPLFSFGPSGGFNMVFGPK